ncbi:hypothetical protein HDU93_006167 [Gonapodya sp. JEL0774]|nr:hypothetical protein HDU93_006167 [Gonapodya sp. JEL0774]
MVLDGSRLPKPRVPASSSAASKPEHNPYAEVIGEFRALKRSGEAAAMALLKQVASQVKPIMKKRGWRVGILEEFFPSNASLLGLNTNGGQKISLRLRPSSSPETFLPLEDCVGTMLHELAHIIRGPHDEQFYKALDALEKEHDALVEGGYRGEGFEAPGMRVGHGVSHDVPIHTAKQKAVEAAEKRRRLNSWGGTGAGSGRRLGARTAGGVSDEARVLEKVLSPVEMAAWAAERRAKRDGEWCGSQGGPGEESERRNGEGAENRDGDEVARATSLVRYEAGSRFPAHIHGGGEEFFVLEGVFGDEHAEYPTGWYVRNKVGSSHSPYVGPTGCLIFVKLRWMRPDEPDLRVDTTKMHGTHGIHTLYTDEATRAKVAFVVLQAGKSVELGGDEVGWNYLLQGGWETVVANGNVQLSWGAETSTFSSFDWIRFPPRASEKLLMRNIGANEARILLRAGYARAWIKEAGDENTTGAGS